MSGILSARLLLRQWKQSDFEPFAKLNADPEVMCYFPAVLSRSESDGLACRHQGFIEEHGWGRWAAEERATGQFLGFIGLYIPPAALPFAPCVEIGWRLAKAHWGTGLATEGAAAALSHAFDTLNMAEVVSFTSIHNVRSQAVMQRLGMRRDKFTFAHPSLPEDHRLSENCLYRISSPLADPDPSVPPHPKDR